MRRGPVLKYVDEVTEFLNERLFSPFDPLTMREKAILGFRYITRLTHSEIGARFEVTRDRIRQIEAKALRKLKIPREFYEVMDVKRKEKSSV